MKLTKDMKQSRFRIPMELLEYLKKQAETNIRSVNAELVIRLMKSMEQDKKEGRH
ncbi:Arc family DNA-binding protein [Aeromonas enterica]